MPWPETELPGFLSYQNCPNLWTLGARPYLGRDKSLSIIEEIITCANILPQRTMIKDKIYIRAYNELEQYLMSLFVYYTDKVDILKKKKQLKEWGWVKYLKKLYADANVKSINTVSLNYDVWLEKLLDLFALPYSIDGFSANKKNTYIYTPHGSIALHSAKRDKSAYALWKDLTNIICMVLPILSGVIISRSCFWAQCLEQREGWSRFLQDVML